MAATGTDSKWQTRAVRAGQVRTPEGEHSDPVFLTSSYVFSDAAEAARRFSGDEAGNVYSRYTNPTVRGLEQRMAALEQAPAAVATASGMSAILSTCMALLESGDHVVCASSVFGATVGLFNRYLAKFGVPVDYVDETDSKAWARALRPNTRMMFMESPSNPLVAIYDIPALAAIAKEHDAILVVDNCFCTPALQQPLTLGADIVIHSATKYLDGQGRCMGGIVLGDEERMDAVRSFLRTAGPCISPFNAWVIHTGLETLGVRMDRHCTNAMKLAERLQDHPRVKCVHYAGLSDHRGHALATRQQRAYGGVLSFEVEGGRAKAWQIIDAITMLSVTANLGDTKTTITHPASTTHARLSDSERASAGITEGLIRISVGLEDVDDIYDDLRASLEHA